MVVLDSLRGMVVGRVLEDFFDMFWPKPPSKHAESANDKLEAQPHVSEEFKEALGSMATGTGSCAGPLADLVRKFELWPGHELSLRSSDPDAFCWGTMEPRDDPRPCWARPQILFRFCEEELAAPLEWDDHVRKSVHEKCKVIDNDVLAEMQHHFVYQQLTAVFVVLVYGRTHLCVSRWDRSGAVESMVVDFVAEPQLLIELFQRLSTAADDQLGLDLTASPVLPGSTDYELMDRFAEPCAEDIDAAEGTVLRGNAVHAASPPTFKTFREVFARMLQPPADSEYPGRASTSRITTSRWKLSVPGPAGSGEPRDFLVGRPFQCRDDSDVDWRNTRSYVALDCSTQRFVFLKDAWRGVGRSDNVESEGDILAALNAAGVPHVPTVVCHADLQRTVTSRYRYAGYGYVAADAGPRRHFRMVVQELGLRLNYFTSGRQIASVVSDCVIAHAEAAKALKLLHGDLGPYNIVICPKVDAATDAARPTVTWEGMLIDWEAVKWFPGAPNYARIPNQMGSRCYQSIACMLESEKRFEIADELESFLYTLLWCGIRWLRSNCTDARTYIDQFFDFDCGPYGLRPSAWKRRMLERNELLLLDGTALHFHGDRVADSDAGDSDSKEGCDRRRETPFDSLLRELLSWCHANAREHLSPGWNTWPVRSNGFMHLKDCPPGLRRPDAAVPAEDREVLAAKLDDHDAIRELFARKLGEEWPTDDFAGDKWQIRAVQPPEQTVEEDEVEALVSAEEPYVEEKPNPKRAREETKVQVGATKEKKGRGKAATKTVEKVAAGRKLQAITGDSRCSRRLRGELPLEPVEEWPAKRQRRR